MFLRRMATVSVVGLVERVRQLAGDPKVWRRPHENRLVSVNLRWPAMLTGRSLRPSPIRSAVDPRPNAFGTGCM